MKLVSGDPAKMTVLHAGYVLQQCFDVALPAHRDPRRPLAPVPACKFLDGVTEPADWGIEFRGAAKLDAVGHEPAPVARACSPFYCLALLSSLGFLGVLMLGLVRHVVGTFMA